MAASTSQARLDQLLPDWQAQLQLWAQTGSLVAAAQEALILSGTPSALQGLINQWCAGDFSGLPPIVLLSASDISGAMGAYAISTGTIHLNADWLATASQEQANAVLTEELGHHLDGFLNTVDTPGDEGEYFAGLLSGGISVAAEKTALRTQDDSSLVLSNGAQIAVENAAASLPPEKLLHADSLYYRLTLNSENWYQASAKAATLGGTLISIDNQQEQDFVVREIGQFVSHVVTGLSDLDVNGVYQKPDGSALTYSNFLPGYPNPWGMDQSSAWALIVTRTHFASWESNWSVGQWYCPSATDLLNTQEVDTVSGEYNIGAYAEIPLELSITRSGTVKEGAVPFTTSINLSAGTLSSGNLAEGATIYWSITGITGDDLASGSLTGSGTITNGKLDIQHSLKVDADTGEQFSVSVYSDAARTQQIGTTSSVSVQEGGPVLRGNSLYRLTPIGKWTDGESAAVQLGGHLVTINDAAENAWILQNIAGDAGGGWIGFYQTGAGTGYRWVSGELAAYTNWGQGLPDFPSWEFYSYMGGGNGLWGDCNNTGDGNGGLLKGIAEIPLILSITRTGTVKEGAAPFTTSINLSAGTQSSGNLAEGATAYWSISGITADDLASGSLTGSGTITNGMLDIQHSLKVDTDTGEQFSVSVYSDAARTQLIGEASSTAVQEALPQIFGNSLYLVVEGRSWTQAEANSSRYGGHLASIADANENKFLYDCFNSATGTAAAWIGGTDQITEGEWTSSEGMPLSYTNWAPNEPNNNYNNTNDEDYAALVFDALGITAYSAHWNDLPNSLEGLFVSPWSSIRYGIAEIPLSLTITRTGAVKEGSAPFTTSINLSAGTQSSGNLAEGATVYWSITGITDADLASGSLTGSGTITNGKLDIQHYLKVDADTGEQFSVSVYSDPTRTQLIGATYSVVVQEALQPSNNAPTDISLTSSGILENSPAGTLIGTLAATDPDQGSSFTYDLVQGNGSNDTDNAFVDIVGNQLRVKAGALIDYETNASLQLNIRVTDNGSPALSFTKAFSINIGNVNEAPTDISLTSSGILENSPAGTLIGTLAASDPDQGSSFTYELVQGNGSNDADNPLVDIVGNQLRVKAGAVIDYETNASLQLNIRVTDNGSPALSFTKAFSVNVGDVNEVPPANPVDDQSYTLDYSVDGYRLATTGKQNLSVLGADKLKSWALWGDDQSNRLIGGSKEDVLIGGGETDYLTGGLGSDTFVMTDWDQRKFDFITDFNAKDDAIGISKYMMDVSADASVEVVRYNDIKNAKTAQETFDDAQADVYVFLGSTKQIQALQAKDWTQGIQLVVDSKRKVITYDSDGNWTTGAQTLAQFTGKFSTAWTGDNFLFGLDIPL